MGSDAQLTIGRPLSPKATKWLVALAVMMAVGIAYRECARKKVFPLDSQLDLQAVGGTDPCVGLQYCVVVYLAPWCPACKEVAAQLPETRAQFAESGRVGMKVVIGAADAATLEAFARQLAPPVFLDNRGTMQRKLHIGRFPSFFVVRNDDRTMIARSGAARGWIQSKAWLRQP